MTVISKTIHLNTQGDTDAIDLTPQIQSFLSEIDIKNGIVNINACGSTGAITTIEYESGLLQDIKDIFNKLIPAGNYHHDQAWGDGNGHAHLRSSLVGSSATYPFKDGQLVLGTWQQIIFVDFDNRSRRREIFLQFVGEA